MRHFLEGIFKAFAQFHTSQAYFYADMVRRPDDVPWREVFLRGALDGLYITGAFWFLAFVRIST